MEFPLLDNMKNNHCIRISEMSPEKIDLLKEVQQKVEKVAEKFRKSLSNPGKEPDRPKDHRNN